FRPRPTTPKPNDPMNTAALPRPIVCLCSGRASHDQQQATPDHHEPCPKPAPWRGLVLLALMLGLGLAWVQPAGAQLTFQRIKSFGIPTQAAANPLANLIQGSDGTLYGTTTGSGTSFGGNFGTVFKLNTNGSGFTVLHTFTNSPDGANPSAVVQGADGALYGTTGLGGTYDAGTVFKLNTDGSGYLVLHTFTGTSGDGEKPTAALMLGSDGALYGTTEEGGSGGGGTVFKL